MKPVLDPFALEILTMVLYSQWLMTTWNRQGICPLRKSGPAVRASLIHMTLYYYTTL